MNLALLFMSTLHLASPRTPAYIKQAQGEWVGLAEVTVVSTQCGEENAFYWPSSNTVEMCTELYKNPKLAVAIFHHEMGHAFMYQHDIPNSERGADELSMLMAPPEALVEAAKWFMKMSVEEGPSSGDDGHHQSHLDRAAALLCFVDGTADHPVSSECKVYARSVDEAWGRILAITLP